MPTDNERRALWFLAIVALSGSAVRLARSRTHAPDAGAGIARQIARVDSARQQRDAKRTKPTTPQAKPKAESREPRVESQVDIDRATADELERLPGIGPALAARIVADRDSLGDFGSVEGLCRVRGVGKALLSRLESRATASGSAPVSVACGRASTAVRNGSAPRHAKRP